MSLRGAPRRSNPSGGGRAFRAFAGKPPHHRRAPLRPHFVASYPPPPPRGFAPKPQRHPTACPGAPPAHRTAASRYAACPPIRGLSYLPFKVKQAAKRQAKRLDAVLCYPPECGLEFAANTQAPAPCAEPSLRAAMRRSNRASLPLLHNLCNQCNLWTNRTKPSHRHCEPRSGEAIVPAYGLLIQKLQPDVE
jgi:hypothetical protein